VAGPVTMLSCNVSPASVTVGSSPGSSTLTVIAPTSLALMPAYPSSRGKNRGRFLLMAAALVLCGMGLAGWNLATERRSPWLLHCATIALLAALAGCGVMNAPPPNPQHYTVTVTASSGALLHTANVRVTVQ
jgi:hypothetical protein